MPTLLDFITQRPLDEKPTDPVTCPFCGTKGVTTEQHEQTCVGGIGPVDPNHHWYYCRCQECHKHFTREVKAHHVWYTEHRDGVSVVLKGVSGCFEPYTYTCKVCGGPVRRHHEDLTGKVTRGCSYDIQNGQQVPLFTTHYTCPNGHGGQVGAEE